MMIHYGTQAMLTVSRQEAVRFATVILCQNGFKIERQNTNGIVLSGPGLQSTRQNPLLGASQVELSAERTTLALEAELGGVDSMRRFLIVLPLALGMVFFSLSIVTGGVVVAVNFGQAKQMLADPGHWWLWLMPLWPVWPIAPWMVLGPLMSRWMRSRTERALETLVHNAACASDICP